MFDKLSIAVTRRCNASCEVCCFGCSPAQTSTLEEADIRRAIRQAKDAGGVKKILFTGGEPLLYYDRVRACTGYASELGLSCAVYTNGFWGDDGRRAARWAQELASVGVKTVHFSSDAYHQRYVPFASLRTALRSVREAGIAGELSIMETTTTSHLAAAREALGDELAAARLTVHPLLPVGAAKDLVDDATALLRLPSSEARCIYDGMACLMFDGFYYLCCSMYARSIPRIRLAHMDKAPFSELADIAYADDYLCIMLEEGFGWFVRKMSERGRPFPERVCFPCACCERIFADHAFLSEMRDEAAEHARELRSRRR